MVNWYKTLIILIWLAVPVTGGVMMRHHYNSYMVECQIQRNDIALRESHLRNFTMIISDYAGRLQGMYHPTDIRAWDRDYREMQRTRKSESLKLRVNAPEYYLDTDKLLLELEDKLREQEETVVAALGYRRDYLDAGTLIDTLNQQILQVEMDAGYYRRIGAVGIYLLKQETLALLEEELRSRRRMRSRAQRSYDSSIAAAAANRRDIMESLGHLDDKLNLDEQKSYREELYRRLAEFRLGQEIGLLVRSLDSTPGQSS